MERFDPALGPRQCENEVTVAHAGVKTESAAKQINESSSGRGIPQGYGGLHDMRLEPIVEGVLDTTGHGMP